MNVSSEEMTKQKAQQVCEEIRRESKGKFWTLAGWQCWGCTTFTGGNPDKRCYASSPNYRGCALVNARYDRRYRQG